MGGREGGRENRIYTYIRRDEMPGKEVSWCTNRLYMYCTCMQSYAIGF